MTTPSSSCLGTSRYRQKFIDAVERLSGRGVLAFISNQQVGPDLEIELFLLQPEPDERVAVDHASERRS